jgi:plastocyanin
MNAMKEHAKAWGSRSAVGLSFLLLALSACGKEGPESGGGKTRPTRTSQQHTVYMGLENDPNALVFDPAELSIEVGDSVVWVNRSKTMTHTATREAPDFNEMRAAGNSDPSNAIRFSVASGEAGLEYHCTVRGHEQMIGRILVLPTSGRDPIEHTVYMGREGKVDELVYDPPTQKVEVGDSVVWRNRSRNMTHSATREAPFFDVPRGAGNMQPSDPVVFEDVSAKVGLEYRCKIKGHEKMIGRIFVKEPAAR